MSRMIAMNNLKKLTAAALMLCMILSLTACGGSKKPAGSTEMPLADMIEEIYKDVDAPAYETVPLDSEIFEFFTFIPYDEKLEGVEADAMINASPHSVVLVHAKDGGAAEVAEQIAANANPRKWICVGADDTKIAYTEHYVLLVMSYTDVVEGMVANFTALAETLNEGAVTVLESSFEGGIADEDFWAQGEGGQILG